MSLFLKKKEFIDDNHSMPIENKLKSQILMIKKFFFDIILLLPYNLA
jgi:hypothetical protein